MSYDEFLDKIEKTVLSAQNDGITLVTITDLKFYATSKRISKKSSTLKSLKGLI